MGKASFTHHKQKVTVKYKSEEKSIFQFRPLMAAASCEAAFGLKREMSKGQASVKEMPRTQ